VQSFFGFAVAARGWFVFLFRQIGSFDCFIFSNLLFNVRSNRFESWRIDQVNIWLNFKIKEIHKFFISARGRGRGMLQSSAARRPGGDGGLAAAAAAGSVASTMVEMVRLGSSTDTTRGSTNASESLAKRPNYGTTGRQIQLRTNNFVVNIRGGLFVHQYRIEIACEFKQLKK
jgi:hypothetical protein